MEGTNEKIYSFNFICGGSFLYRFGFAGRRSGKKGSDRMTGRLSLIVQARQAIGGDQKVSANAIWSMTITGSATEERSDIQTAHRARKPVSFEGPLSTA